jgi:hypothetical protein
MLIRIFYIPNIPVSTNMSSDRDRYRTVTIPKETYRSVKHTSAEMERSIMELLAIAWEQYFDKSII